MLVTETTTATKITTPISIEEFEFGQSPEELLNTLKKHCMELIPSQFSEPDGRLMYDESFVFETEDARFVYSLEGVQERIIINSPRIRTSHGVGVGDRFDELVAAHGTDFIDETFDYRWIEYFDGEKYLCFAFEADVVQKWHIKTGSTKVASPISIEEFEFGQSPEELMNTLKKHDMELIANQFSEPDGRVTEWGVFRYDTEDAIFLYTAEPEGIQDRIIVNTPRIRTSLGIGVGDRFGEVVAAYGTDFIEKTQARRYIEYYDGEKHLGFSFEEDGYTVQHWYISTRSLLVEYLPYD